MFELIARLFGLFLAIVFAYMIGTATDAPDWVLALIGFSFGSLMPEFMVLFGYWVKENV